MALLGPNLILMTKNSNRITCQILVNIYQFFIEIPLSNLYSNEKLFQESAAYHDDNFSQF